MSNTVFNNHPLIKNSNQYFLETKYITISSQDRDMIKYPQSNEFEISLPQEYLNVASAKLYSWSFPANYDVFSSLYYNLTMSFKFEKLYNPAEHNFSNLLAEGIFAALHRKIDTNIEFRIEEGFYNPTQMSTELTNKFNAVTTKIIDKFFNTPSEWDGVDYTTAKVQFEATGGYNRFKVVYNAVSQKLWFGNNADQFILTNSTNSSITKRETENNCLRKQQLPEWSNWGLPSYLGFDRNDVRAETTTERSKILNINSDDSESVPRFYYGDAVPGSGDNGYWLLPVLPGAEVYFLEAPLKISFMGQAYIYMEIDGWNCIDETIPYNLSKYTLTHSQTNGVVNSCFAKIAVPTTPISQWFDNDMGPYKYWNPPAERISKLRVKFRYHNGYPVDFGQFEYSFMLELNLLKPQQERSYSIVNAYNLSQQQSFASKYV